jgi:glycosyltransferase involved in cell wall biosynthesis
VLILIENLPAPFDRRVWQQATTLQAAGYVVSIICPTGKGFEARHECIEGIHIYRHPLPHEAAGVWGYALEYGAALFWEFRLAFKVWRRHGFDVIQACNPPDLLFLVGGFFKLLAGKKFIFDHHDLNPELFEAKFGKRGPLYRLMCWLERLTFATADVAIATNESYRHIALTRGRMAPERVFVVRSGPSLERMRITPPVHAWRHGRAHLVGYVGVMGAQEGIDILLRVVRHITARLGRHDIHFVLVGGGTSLDAMKAYARALGVSEFVSFTGRVNDSTLLEVLNTAEVCVNPDVPNAMNDLSTMNKIMEYMALAKPIVQFDLREGRVSAQEASLYAKPHEEADFAAKIIHLIDHPEEARQRGQFGLQRVRGELAWAHEAPKLLAAYEALWAGDPRQRPSQAPEHSGRAGRAP